MFSTKRLNIVLARDSDIKQIIDIENHPDNRAFIWSGTYEEHLAEIHDPNYLLLVFRERTDDHVIGFALIKLDYKSNVFELRRIAITEKGAGYGREAMMGIIKYAFEETETNRFWLDVYPDNYVGIKLYESLGLRKEGVLRQSYKSSRGYLDQIIYSMLRSEYTGM